MHGDLRKCERKDGTKANGILTFYISKAVDEDIDIEENTICSKESNPLIQYKTVENATIKAGETKVYVSVEALEIGAKYNAKVGEVTTLVNAPAKIEGVSNEIKIDGGSDYESDSAFRKRIVESFRLPLTGYNKYSVESVIRNIDAVSDCMVKFSNEKGVLNIVVSSSEELSDNTKRQIKKSVAQSDLFGVEVNIIQATRVDFDIKAKVLVNSALNDETKKQEIYDALFEILDRKRIGHIITLDEMKKALFKLDGVGDVSIESDKAVNNSIVCSTDEFLNLNSLEVELYEL